MDGQVRAVTALGAGCAFGLLLAPAVLPAGSPDAVVPSVLPLGFFVAGCVAQVLRRRHPVGDRLLAVGVLHLAALTGAVLAAVAEEPATPLAWISAVLYALGFAALLDLLARYPTGRYAWPAVGPVVRVAGAGAVLLAALALLGSAETPSVLGFDTGRNPLHVPALGGLSSAVAAVALLPVAGLVLLLVRYRSAPATDRAQMRWPIATAALTAVGLLTTGLAERLLGPTTQTALFVTAAAALPLSFLVGLLRHSEEADRLAAVEASRARLAEVADAERQRIERDLHDGAQQRILALLARVELARGHLDEAERDAELRAIAADLRSVHRELRELARGVYPATLSDHGLPEALRSALARVPGAAELTVAPAVEGRRFPGAVEGAAYFLVLEGLANTMKHAGAAKIRVGLDATEDELQVTVTDSGRGFDPAGTDGTGLLGLRDRVAAVGGSLEIDSGPGRGTTLRGLLPAVGHAPG